MHSRRDAAGRWPTRIGIGTLALFGLAMFACANTDEVAIGAGEAGDAGGVSFTPNDATAPKPDANDFRALCTSTTCPAPYGTCSTDTFRCETNFDTDNDNCGACGVACPNGDSIRAVFGAEWFCQSGRCGMTCDVKLMKADCNHRSNDGCETNLTCDVDNCGACGVKCSGGMPCVKGNCGCAPGRTACGQGCSASCEDLANDDFNCGACDNVCPFTPPDPPPPPHMHLGCGDSHCGALKCDGSFKDCNDDLADGCEAGILQDPKNCGACGFACAEGLTCESGKCKCAPHETRCTSAFGAPSCKDLSADPQNCGACGNRCPTASGTGKAVCRFGRCEIECRQGFADCDGRTENACETFIAADPRNCGGCGIQCDLASGQPCVNGSCLLAPCNEGPPK